MPRSLPLDNDVRENRREEARVAWIKGRHAEGRDRHARYYAINDHPNSRSFGQADLIDGEGREYRVAPSGHVPGKYVRLWLRVPRGVGWFRERPGPRLRVTLRLPGTATEASANAISVSIRELYRSAPTHRTAHLYVPEIEFPPELVAHFARRHDDHQ